MDTDNYTQPLESVMREERKPRPLPLKARDHMELFEEWVRINPDAMREIELTALAVDARGIRVSTKYLIEKQRRRRREAQSRDVLRRSGQPAHIRNMQHHHAASGALAARTSPRNEHLD